MTVFLKHSYDAINCEQISIRKTGYIFSEWYMWHDSGSISFSTWVEEQNPPPPKKNSTPFANLQAVKKTRPKKVKNWSGGQK